MATAKPPNYVTGKGRGGKGWTFSLISAQSKGARIVVEETRVPVRLDRDKTPAPHGSKYMRPWVDRRGNRYDSRECVAVF